MQASGGFAYGVDGIKQRPHMLVRVRGSLGRGDSACKRVREWCTVLMGSNYVPACWCRFVTVSNDMQVSGGVAHGVDGSKQRPRMLVGC